MPDTNFVEPSSERTRFSRAKRLRDEAASVPRFPARFLEPPDFVWGSYTAPDGAKLRWGHLPAATPRAECVMVGGFSECIENTLRQQRTWLPAACRYGASIGVDKAAPSALGVGRLAPARAAMTATRMTSRCSPGQCRRRADRVC